MALYPVTPDYKGFQEIMNKHAGPDKQVTEEEAREAFHNLVGYVTLLLEINDRVGVVPELQRKNKRDETKAELPKPKSE